jgi:pyruvate kinase
MALEQRPDKTCAIMMDTMGPEISLGYMKENKEFQMKAGQTFKIVTDVEVEGDGQKVACTYA